MNRRMWHRDDPCIVVSGKAFVEEIDSASSSVLFPRYRSRWRGTFPDALITSPTLLLDVEACIPSAASSLGPSFARLVTDVLAPRKPGRITTRSVGADTQSGHSVHHPQSGCEPCVAYCLLPQIEAEVGDVAVVIVAWFGWELGLGSAIEDARRRT